MGMRQKSHYYMNELEKAVQMFGDYLVAAMEMIDVENKRYMSSVEFLAKNIMRQLETIEDINGGEEKWMYSKVKKDLEKYTRKDA